MHGYKLACKAWIPMECSASKERVVARVAHHWRTHICQAALRLPTKARAILQRFNLFARDLQRGLGLIGLRSPLSKRAAWHARPRRGASLRAAFVAFRGKTNAVSGLGLSAGATRRYDCSITSMEYARGHTGDPAPRPDPVPPPATAHGQHGDLSVN